MAETIKEADIRPDQLFSEFMRLSSEDAERFFDKSKFVAVACPGCGGTAVVDSFTKHTFRYNHCASCASIYVSPRPDPSELLRYYAKSASQRFWSERILRQTSASRKTSIVLPNIERIATIVGERKPTRVLDIGSGSGTFLAEWKKRHPEAELIGIEPGPEGAETCRAAGMTVREDFVENVTDVQGDLVTCFEVVEHVQDPEAFVRAVRRVTAPKGIAVMSCLGADGFDIQVLWEQSRSLMPPYHLNFLSIAGMTALFKRAEFADTRIFTPGRLDVQIVQRAIERGSVPRLSRFERLLLSRGSDVLQAFQEFLAAHRLSSHVWIVAHTG